MTESSWWGGSGGGDSSSNDGDGNSDDNNHDNDNGIGINKDIKKNIEKNSTCPALQLLASCSCLNSATTDLQLEYREETL